MTENGFWVLYAPEPRASPRCTARRRDYHWSDAGGTFFWVDPQQQLIGIFMLQAPSVRQYYRQLIKSLVLQAIVE